MEKELIYGDYEIIKLKKIKDNEKLRTSLDNFLNKNKKNKSSFLKKNNNYEFREYLRNKFKPIFINYIEELSSIYNIEKRYLYMYFSLDKNFLYYLKDEIYTIFGSTYIYIEEHETNINLKQIVFLYNPKKRYYISIKNKTFLEKYKEYLPTSTKNYINKNLKDRKYIPKVESISNSFERIIFENTLPDKYSTKKCMSYIKHFMETEENSEKKFRNVFFATTSICNKYKEKIRAEDINEIVEIFFKIIDNIIYSKPEKIFQEIYELSEQEDYIYFFDKVIDFMTEIEINKVNDKFIWFMDEITKKEENKYKIKEIRYIYLKKFCNVYGCWDFRNATKEIQDLIYEDVLRQTREKYPNLVK